MLVLTRAGRQKRATQQRWDRIQRADERNQAWAEMFEWREKVEAAIQHGWPLPVGGGFIKARYEISAGLLGRESGWDIDTMPIADFGNVTLAGAGTIRCGFNTFPLVNVSGTVAASPDPEPYQLSTLAATNASRVAGSSTNPMSVLVGAYLVHITSGAAVYQPAGSTVNVRSISTVTTAGAGFTTVATINATTAANFVDAMVISSPAERQIATPTGTLLSTVAGLFNGDSTFCELVTSGALTVVGNLLYVELEVM